VTASNAAPHAHRQRLQRIIAGLNEGIILIEPDGAIAWANDSALALHAVETLQGLGQTPAGYRKRFALTYRNHHRVPARHYPLDRLAAAEPFDDLQLDLTRKDDADFLRNIRARGLLLEGDGGDYRVLILDDQTDQFNAEQRFERTFGANPAPALICRLSDLRYVKVNQGFLDMTGLTRDAVLGKSAYELDVLDGGDDKDDAVAKLNAGLTITQREGVLRLTDGGAKFVIVAGQPIDMHDEPCMLFTFIDLEKRKRAEEALQQSEERFSKAFRLAPVPMALCEGESLRALDINDAFAQATGASPDDAAGQELTALGLRPFEGMAESLARGESVRNRDSRCRGGRQRTGLPGVGRAGHDRRRTPRAAGDAGHHRTQTQRDRAADRDRGRDAGYVLVQPRDHREAGATAVAGACRARRGRTGATDLARTRGAGATVPGTQ